MHVVMKDDWDTFFTYLKLRWVNYNPDKTLKVFGVPERSLMSYHQTAGQTKYNISNAPDEKYRVRDEEILAQQDYLDIKSGAKTLDDIDQKAQDFDFNASRDTGDDISSGDSTSKGEGGDENLTKMAEGMGGEADQGLIDDMRGSIMVNASDEAQSALGSHAPTLADFKMIIVLGKGTFGKVFLSEFN